MGIKHKYLYTDIHQYCGPSDRQLAEIKRLSWKNEDPMQLLSQKEMHKEKKTLSDTASHMVHNASKSTVSNRGQQFLTGSSETKYTISHL